MSEALRLLQTERDRKIALRDSYKRQLDDLEARRDQHQEQMQRLRDDMERLKPPSPILQKEYDKLVVKDQALANDQQKVRADMNNMSKEVLTLTSQIKQLGGE